MVPIAVKFSGYFVSLLVFNSKIYCMKISIRCTSSNLVLSFVEVKPNKNESEKLDLSFSICKIKKKSAFGLQIDIYTKK